MPSSSVVVWRPPGVALIRAPAIGRPSLASVTVPVMKPVGTVVMRMAWLDSRIDSKKPIWRASVPVAFSMPTVAVRPSPGFGGLLAVQEVDRAVLPELDLEVEQGGRAEDAHVGVLDDEGAVRGRADGLRIDRRRHR